MLAPPQARVVRGGKFQVSERSCPLSIKARTFFQNHTGSTRIAEAIISLMRADAATRQLCGTGIRGARWFR